MELGYLILGFQKIKSPITICSIINMYQYKRYFLQIYINKIVFLSYIIEYITKNNYETDVNKYYTLVKMVQKLLIII